MKEEGRKNVSSSICLGRVVTQNPVTVKVGDLILGVSDLLIADIVNNLRSGDNLIMAPIANKQKYIILCKVVSL